MLKKKECCIVMIVSENGLKGMSTFSSSAQHDIVYLYNDGSEMCTVRIVAMFEWSKSVICEIKRWI